MKIFAQSNNVVRADPIHNRRDSSAVVRILNSGGLIRSDAKKIEPKAVVKHYCVWFDFYCIRRYIHMIALIGLMYDLRGSVPVLRDVLLKKKALL